MHFVIENNDDEHHLIHKWKPSTYSFVLIVQIHGIILDLKNFFSLILIPVIHHDRSHRFDRIHPNENNWMTMTMMKSKIYYIFFSILFTLMINDVNVRKSKILLVVFFSTMYVCVCFVRWHKEERTVIQMNIAFQRKWIFSFNVNSNEGKSFLLYAHYVLFFPLCQGNLSPYRNMH